VKRFIAPFERDASPRQVRISAERAPGRFSMPCGRAGVCEAGKGRAENFDQKIIAINS
tara:strand:- start:1236 stop:1409 length:174 start_codon:yes stop_codon:yes gene_type:complete